MPTGDLVLALQLAPMDVTKSAPLLACPGRPPARHRMVDSLPRHRRAQGRLEHVPKKLLDFFDQDMLQLFDFELRPYRSHDSI